MLVSWQRGRLFRPYIFKGFRLRVDTSDVPVDDDVTVVVTDEGNI